jgi:hypothetical protein
MIKYVKISSKIFKNNAKKKKREDFFFDRGENGGQ